MKDENHFQDEVEAHRTYLLRYANLQLRNKWFDGARQ